MNPEPDTLEWPDISPECIRQAGGTPHAAVPADEPLFGHLKEVTAVLRSLPLELRGPALVLLEPRGVRDDRIYEWRESFTVGRDSKNDLSVPDDDELSRHHFRIVTTDGRSVLTDTGSSNGTLVLPAGRKIRERVLHDGDIVLAGRQRFLFVQRSDPPLRPDL